MAGTNASASGLKGALVAALGGGRRSKSDATADEKIIQEAKDRFKRCSDWESKARNRRNDDIKFCEGDSDNLYQWEDAIYKARQLENKPALTINKTRQHCLQIVNDARQNKAQVEIRPVGNGATYEAAKVFEGIVRHIEYISNAADAYDTATWHQVTGGWGYWRVITDYVDEKSFDQEIFIRRVPDPLSVYLDPDIQEFDGSDARFGFVFEDLPREEFDRKCPRWKDEAGDEPLGNDSGGWNDKDHKRVAEYYRKSEKSDTLLLIQMPDGTQQTVAESELPDGARDMIPPESIINERETKRDEIEWFKIAGDKIVERSVWPGSYIPLVRIIGEETIIDGELDRKGHTRALKDPQRMYNWWSSAAVEFGALQTKVPWVGPAGAFEGHEDEWANANTSNKAYLTYNHVDDAGRDITPPQRLQPPTTLPAAMEGMKVAQMELMMASGQYQSQFGENENAKSGVAIQTRQRQGDNATYHYIEHQAKAIRFTGKILIDLIPKIYDTPRVIKILAENGDESEVHVQPNSGQPHQMLVEGQPASAEQVKAAQADPDMADKVQAIFDPSVGKYEVQADIGPAFATRRQEAFNAFSQIMSQNPEAFKIGADIMFRAADFPMADELAERLKRTIPPDVLGEGPPPQLVQAQQQMQAMQEQFQHVAQGLVQQAADATQKLKDREEELKLKDYEAETRRMSALAAVDPEALKPVIRQLVSEALGTPIVPLMAQHREAEQFHGLGAPEAPAEPTPITQ